MAVPATPLVRQPFALAAAALVSLLLLQSAQAAPGLTQRGRTVPTTANVGKGNVASALAAYGTVVYAADTVDGTCGGKDPLVAGNIVVYDLADPVKPKSVNTVATPPNTRATHIDVQELNGRVVMVAAINTCTGYMCEAPVAPAYVPQCLDRGFMVYDLTENPSEPVQVTKAPVPVMALNNQQGAWGANYIPPGAVQLFARNARTYVVVAAGWHPEAGPMLRGLRIYDITDTFEGKEATLASSWGVEDLLFPGLDFTVFMAGDKLFDDALLAISGGTAMPLTSGGTNLGPIGSTLSVTVRADPSGNGDPTAFAAQGSFGLVEIDIGDPSKPVPIYPTTLTMPDYYVAANSTLGSAASVDTSLVVQLFGSVAGWTSSVSVPKTGAVAGPAAGVAADEVDWVADIMMASQGGMPASLGDDAPKVELKGDAYYIGTGCGPLNAAPGMTSLAVVMRGGCSLWQKEVAVKAAGYKAMIEVPMPADAGVPSAAAESGEPGLDIPFVAIDAEAGAKVMTDVGWAQAIAAGAAPAALIAGEADVGLLVSSMGYGTVGSAVVWDLNKFDASDKQATNITGLADYSAGCFVTTLTSSTATLCIAPPGELAPRDAVMATHKESGTVLAFVASDLAGLFAVDVTDADAVQPFGPWTAAGNATEAESRFVAVVHVPGITDTVTIAVLSADGSLATLGVTLEPAGGGDSSGDNLKPEDSAVQPATEGNGSSNSSTGSSSSDDQGVKIAVAVTMVVGVAAIALLATLLVRRHKGQLRMAAMDEPPGGAAPGGADGGIQMPGAAGVTPLGDNVPTAAPAWV